jgi:hypothetical protein
MTVFLSLIITSCAMPPLIGHSTLRDKRKEPLRILRIIEDSEFPGFLRWAITLCYGDLGKIASGN